MLLDRACCVPLPRQIVVVLVQPLYFFKHSQILCIAGELYPSFGVSRVIIDLYLSLVGRSEFAKLEIYGCQVCTFLQTAVQQNLDYPIYPVGVDHWDVPRASLK